jgi:broad specificity phosphatase PhoE
MTLYLVRHGESEGNVGKRFQNHEEKLTELGEKQARVVAQRFAKIRVDAIVASTMTRAQQTAGEIAKVVGKEIIPQSLFVEMKQPSEVVGKFHKDQNAVTIIEKVNKNKHNPTYHYSDEENYFDFISRVDAALHTLEQYGDDENVVVVAHGHVVRAVVGIILFGTDLSSRNFDMLKDHLSTTNTGISVASYSPERGWQLVTFNDHAHLLE